MLKKLPIIKRLYPSICKRWARLTWPGGYKLKAYNGLLLTLNHKNYIDRQIAFYGGYEQAQLRHLSAHMQKGCDLFIDVGANFGLYSLQIAKHNWALNIHAFEPDARNYAQFGGNMYLNKLSDKITLHRFAVSDKKGDLSFVIYPETSTGQTRVANQSEATTTLHATTLDDTFQLEGKRITIKIDIEGHELAALKGAERLLKNNQCFLQIESFPENAKAIEAFLRDYDYHLQHRIDDDYYFAIKRP